MMQAYEKLQAPPGSGDRLRAARKAKNMKVRTLAKRTGIHAQSIYNYEEETSVMSIATLLLLCEALDVTPNYLLRGDTEDGKSE